MTVKRYAALNWFRVSVELGLLLNLGFALPALFAPRFVETLASYGESNTLYWLQNVGILLIIVTAMYVPVIRDPFRYLYVTVLVVAGRFAAGTLFLFGLLFLDYPDGFGVLAGTDLVLSTIQALLLHRMLNDGDPRSGHPV